MRAGCARSSAGIACCPHQEQLVMSDQDAIVVDPWSPLRQFTAARIALGRAGHALPLREVLALRLAHAKARDAVHEPFDDAALREQILAERSSTAQPSALAAPSPPALAMPSEEIRAHAGEQGAAAAIAVHRLASCAVDRLEYLRRPDKGRTLDDESVALLSSRPANEYGRDVVVVVADGLSAIAVHAHAAPLVGALLARFAAAAIGVGAVCLVRQGRVAIGDEIGQHLRARLALVIIGERPGLTAPDSLGAYLTYAPRPGLTDDSRNCVSNIRPAGLPPAAAADRIASLVREALRRQLSGVALKDDGAQLPPPP
jgi:ethanolamine ammonia-lyase small subunit